MATSELIPPHIRQALTRDADEMVASAARDYRPGAGNASAVRAPRIAHRASAAGGTAQ
ncbi:hypothetical protein NKG94_05015 [Micromonospora sp. M12]